jgi:hypothetical protein
MRYGYLKVIVAVLFAILAVNRADAAEKRTLTGTLMSGYQDGADPVRAVFSPRGENQWNVSFFFKFNGYNHAYRGTADGSLSGGELSGEVVNETRQRRFSFSGAIREGKFTGRHAELKRGKRIDTGTITLAE